MNPRQRDRQGRIHRLLDIVKYIVQYGHNVIMQRKPINNHNPLDDARHKLVPCHVQSVTLYHILNTFKVVRSRAHDQICIVLSIWLLPDLARIIVALL